MMEINYILYFIVTIYLDDGTYNKDVGICATRTGTQIRAESAESVKLKIGT